MDSEHVSGYVVGSSGVRSGPERHVEDICILICIYCCSLVAKLCPTLLQPHGPFVTRPGSSDHRVSQARVWKRLSFPTPRNLPHPGINPLSPALAGGERHSLR